MRRSSFSTKHKLETAAACAMDRLTHCSVREMKSSSARPRPSSSIFFWLLCAHDVQRVQLFNQCVYTVG